MTLALVPPSCLALIALAGRGGIALSTTTIDLLAQAVPVSVTGLVVVCGYIYWCARSGR